VAGKGATFKKSRIVREWFHGVMATDAGFDYRAKAISDNKDMQAQNAPCVGNIQYYREMHRNVDHMNEIIAIICPYRNQAVISFHPGKRATSL